MISARDRVSAVLARDERLLDLLTSLSQTFERLRNPAMRKVMARLVTVEQAARMAGLEPALLVERLNQALAAAEAGAAQDSMTEASVAEEAMEDASDGAVDGTAKGAAYSPAEVAEVNCDTRLRSAPSTSDGTVDREGMSSESMPGGIPAALAVVPEELIVDLDVRPDLRRGEEPFSKIMAARRQVLSGGVLRLRATFEPVPLYAVLGKQGMEHWTERFADDDWRVWFYSPAVTPAEVGAPVMSSAPPAAPSGAAGTAAGASAPASSPASGMARAASEAVAVPAPAVSNANPEDDVVIVDVRGLEPPEPMMRTFEALEQLPVGKTLLQLNVRVPQFLLPQLADRGFTYEIREQSKDLVRIFIRHSAGGESAGRE